jgi:hypothetical protein
MAPIATTATPGSGGRFGPNYEQNKNEQVEKWYLQPLHNIVNLQPLLAFCI